MKYEFYIKKNGQVQGPYSARWMLRFAHSEDDLVKEESMDVWLPYEQFDFEKMADSESDQHKLNEINCIKSSGQVAKAPEPQSNRRPQTHSQLCPAVAKESAYNRKVIKVEFSQHKSFKEKLIDSYYNVYYFFSYIWKILLPEIYADLHKRK